MHWTQRVPSAITDVEITEEGFRAKLAIPTSADGFFGRACPACDRFFKVSKAEYEPLPEDIELTCPYCGHQADHGEFMSAEQRDFARKGAEQLGAQFLHDRLHEMMQNTFGDSPRLRPGESGVELRYTPGTPPPVQELPEFVERAIVRTIRCDGCGNHQAVYGASAFCYVCGPRDEASTVIEAIARQRQALALEDEVPADRRLALEAAGVFEGIAADGVKAVVTMFEVYARGELSERAPEPAAGVKAARPAVFQRLADTSDLFEAHAGFALSALVSDDAWARLLQTFEQRHVLIHRDGHVDQRYLDRVRATRLQVGQRLVVTRDEAEMGLRDLEALVNAIEAQPGASAGTKAG